MQNIGIDFIKARLFQDDVKGAIGRETLIESDENREIFTNWNDFPPMKLTNMTASFLLMAAADFSLLRR
ncbi:MAG: hypothetical protein GY801_33290 [bacterium]|nr:hypothetical protein [bacterium]